MKKGLSELVFILDKSGSMAGLESDTIGGYNAMLKEQEALEEESYITTVFFDNSYQIIHDRTNLKGVRPITRTDYQVGGSTALLDAIGITINKIVQAQRNTKESYRAEKVIFVIITDGEENSSREYSSQKVKEMIEKQKSDYGWEFIFLGANIDAVETAGNFGIDADRAVDYLADSQGTQLSYRMVGETVRRFRQEGSIDEESLEEIRQDMEERKK